MTDDTQSEGSVPCRSPPVEGSSAARRVNSASHTSARGGVAGPRSHRLLLAACKVAVCVPTCSAAAESLQRGFTSPTQPPCLAQAKPLLVSGVVEESSHNSTSSQPVFTVFTVGPHCLSRSSV